MTNYVDMEIDIRVQFAEYMQKRHIKVSGIASEIGYSGNHLHLVLSLVRPMTYEMQLKLNTLFGTNFGFPETYENSLS